MCFLDLFKGFIYLFQLFCVFYCISLRDVFILSLGTSIMFLKTILRSCYSASLCWNIKGPEVEWPGQWRHSSMPAIDCVLCWHLGFWELG